jgi:integrase
MALELRKKNGKLLPFFYGRYYTLNKAKVINTGVRWQGTPPHSMRDAGDEAFEQSRQKAGTVLRRRRDEAKEQTARAARPPVHWTSPPLDTARRDAPLDRLLAVTGQPLYRRACSRTWEKWKRGVLSDFLAWAAVRGVATVRQIDRAVTEAYIAHLHAPDAKGRSRTAKTIRTMKTVLALALTQLLPEGGENPFKLIHIDPRDGDRVFSRVPLDAKEIERLLAAAQDDPVAHDLIVTGLSTGLRRGDVCRLRWENVNLRQGVLSLLTSKTQASLYLPILPKLKEVLERRIRVRQTGEVFVFPEAEKLLRENPGGITWRIKKIFTLAFAPPGNTGHLRKLSREKLRASLGDAVRAVQAADMPPARRRRMIALLHAYAEGRASSQMREELGVSRGTLTNLLREAERLSGLRFLPGTLKGVRGITAAMKEVTQTRRDIGVRAASKYDFHALRTSFVTLAINGGISIDKLRALTGHKTVDIVLKHYFKPKGTDVADDLEKALPNILTKAGARAREPGERTPDAAPETQNSELPEGEGQTPDIGNPLCRPGAPCNSDALSLEPGTPLLRSVLGVQCSAFQQVLDLLPSLSLEERILLKAHL